MTCPGKSLKKILRSGLALINRLFRRHKDKHNRTEIPVCFSADENYFMPLYVAIYSLLLNKHKDDFYCVYILDGGIKNKNKKRLCKLKNKFEFNLFFVDINNTRFKDMPCPKNTHFTIATYYRFLLSSIFAKYGKIIYLDCDLIVKNSLFDLYNTDVSDYYFAAVKDIFCKENALRLSLNKYVNAGVLLVNLDKWRRDKIENKLFEYVSNFKEKILWVDQDVLNSVLQNGILYISEKWNLQSTVLAYPDYKEKFYNGAEKSAIVIHYITNDKPWMYGSLQPFRQQWLDVCKKTCYSSCYYKYLFEKLRVFCQSKK